VYSACQAAHQIWCT